MLGKLLKYDIKNIFKYMWMFFFLVIIFATFTRIFSFFDEYLIVKILKGITTGGMYAMIGNIIISLLLRSWSVFNHKLFGNEAYLTYTLPVNKTCLFESKFISVVVMLFGGIVISLLSLIIAYGFKVFETIANFITASSSIVNMSSVMILVIISLFFEFLNILEEGYLAMIIGHNKNVLGNGKICLIGLIIYAISQIFMMMGLLVGCLFNHDIFIIFSNKNPDLSILIPALVTALITYIVFCIILNILCVIRLNKGVNVE